jgi:hypothetical protein
MAAHTSSSVGTSMFDFNFCLRNFEHFHYTGRSEQSAERFSREDVVRTLDIMLRFRLSKRISIARNSATSLEPNFHRGNGTGAKRTVIPLTVVSHYCHRAMVHRVQSEQLSRIFCDFPAVPATTEIKRMVHFVS